VKKGFSGRGVIATVLFLVVCGYDAGAQSFTNGWIGQNILPADTFLNAARWTGYGLSDPLRDSCKVFRSDSALAIHWYLASGSRYKYAQRYIVLDPPISISTNDIFGFDIRGTACRSNKRFMLKFEDPSHRAVVKIWNGLPGIARWCEKVAALKKEFDQIGPITWDSISVISLEVNASSSGDTAADSGTIYIKNLVGSPISLWSRAAALDNLQITAATRAVASNAASAIIARQATGGPLITWKEDATAYLYGQGLALKLLSIEGTWEDTVPKNAAATAAKKLARFLKSNQAAAGYWPRSWWAQTGAIRQNLETDSTVWFGDFPWVITGLACYLKKSRDTAVVSSIDKALNFLTPLIDPDGKLYTFDFLNNAKKEVTSCEAYAAAVLALNEAGDTTRANKVLDYIVANGWDSSLKYFKEGPPFTHPVLFANTWLSPLVNQRGDASKAINALSFVGKALYTRGPDAPWGFDGLGPFATWFEGTLSYISAGGPNSSVLFSGLLPYINADHTVPHYNDSIDGDIWARRWSSLDGTSWLYYAASGISPFSIMTLPSIPVSASPDDGATNLSPTPTLAWNPAANASSYHVQISRNADFTTIVLDDSTVSSNSTAINTSLSSSTPYFWRVAAINRFGMSGWSAKRQFFTALPALALSLYTSKNLTGHSVAAECNPNGASGCPCSALDVGLTPFDLYGEVVSNPREVATYVNAIGYKKFSDTFPNGMPLSLSTFRYTYFVKLPVLPRPDVTQKKNPEAVHLMIQFWDGNNKLYKSDSTTLEGTIYWDLNPWTPDAGKIKIYQYPMTLAPTGITVPADTFWHCFALTVNFLTKKYVSLSVDGTVKDLSDVALAQKKHTDWGNDLSLSITSESEAASPDAGCTKIFTWTTLFKELQFGLPDLIPLQPPLLLSPSNRAMNQPCSLSFVWTKSSGASGYRLQLSTDSSFSVIEKDTSISDSSILIKKLGKDSTFFWHVCARKGADSSGWSEPWRFSTQKTCTGTVCARDFRLNFNRMSSSKKIIGFSLPKTEFVSLIIYTIQGKVAATLVNEEKSAGKYSVNLPITRLSSGNYILSFKAGPFSALKKFQVLN
jgi:hypothetical protein